MKDPALQTNRVQCLMAMISAAVVAICVCVGVTMNLVTLYDQNFDNMGIRTFSMFTVDSNILAGVTMLLCLPYTIDELRTGNYHLPDWVVVAMHISVTAVTLTFLVSLFILAPVKGFVLIFTGSRFFLHGVCPILAIVAFCLFIRHHLVRFRESLLSLIPVFLYAVVYLVMVVFIGEENGGWRDFYGFATRIPLWIPLVSIMPLTFGIGALLRFLHNKSCLHCRQRDADLYRQAFAGADMRKAIAEIARSRRRDTQVEDILVPVRSLQYMLEASGDDLSLEEGCRIYLNAFQGKAEEPEV